MNNKYYGATVRCLTCNTVMQSKHTHDFAVCMCWELGTGIAIDGGGQYLRMAITTDAKYEFLDSGKYFHHEENTPKKEDEAKPRVQKKSKAKQAVHSSKKRVYVKKAKVRNLLRARNRHSSQKG